MDFNPFNSLLISNPNTIKTKMGVDLENKKSR